MLLNEEGEFYSSPEMMVDHFGYEKMMKENAALLVQIHNEWKAQLEKLRLLGFRIAYADTHMFPEQWIPGFKDAMKEWIKKEGLVDHRYFYNSLPRIDDLSKLPGLFETVASKLENGQYFYLVHPALPADDMYLTGNQKVPTEKVVSDREKDARFVIAPETAAICRKYGIQTIRYDEAVRGDYNFVRKWLG